MSTSHRFPPAHPKEHDAALAALGRLDGGLERRRGDRRERAEVAVLSTTKAFVREERSVFRELERRSELRRTADARKAISALT